MRLGPAVGTLALCMASLGVGYYLGSQARRTAAQLHATHKGSDDMDDDEEDSDRNLNAVEGTGPCKLVLVVRTDLSMTSGKIAAQYVSGTYVSVYRFCHSHAFYAPQGAGECHARFTANLLGFTSMR
jgi:hypothetical protein